MYIYKAETLKKIVDKSYNNGCYMFTIIYIMEWIELVMNSNR